jgi:LemA protein
MLGFYIFLVICFILSLVIFLIGISIYNDLIFKKNQVDRSFSSVDILLKKRCDLIPNLVAVVKKHLQFEQQTLAEVTRLRSRLVSGEINNTQRLTLENQLSRSMGSVVAVIENYPELKSDRHISQLLASLNEIEEQISAARRFFNTAVTEYNNAIEMFPTNLFATQMKYRAKQLFIATEGDRNNVDVGSILDN